MGERPVHSRKNDGLGKAAIRRVTWKIYSLKGDERHEQEEYDEYKKIVECGEKY